MDCQKCGEQIVEGAMFCNRCGSKIKQASSETAAFKNKKAIIIGSGSLLVVLVLVVIAFVALRANNPVRQFKQAIQHSDYAKAASVYQEDIKGNSKRENELLLYLTDEIKKTADNFKNQKIDYQTAKESFETLQQTNILTTEISQAVDEMNKLNDSRTAFKTAGELLKNKNIKDAQTQLKKVIEADENYQNAQELIKTTAVEYKNMTLNEAEQLASQQKFAEAIALLTDALAVVPSDSDITAKKTVYDQQNKEKIAAERKKKVEELQTNQEVSVLSSKMVKTGTYFDFYHVQVIVKNNSNKVVKNFNVRWLAYDSQGYPIKLDSSDFLQGGTADAANIQTGKTYGENAGWTIVSNGEKAATVMACVYQVEYYDGSKWTNPYYEYWLEDYKEKPLKISG